MTETSSTTPSSLKYKVPQSLVILYLAAALLVCAAVPVLAAGWMRTPFIGGFLEKNLVYSGRELFKLFPAASQNEGQALSRGDQLVEIASQPVQSAEDVSKALRPYANRQQVSATIKKPDGQIEQAELPLNRLLLSYFTSYLVMPYLVGLVYFIAGLWVFSVRRTETLGKVFAVFAASAAITCAAFFDLFSTHRLIVLWLIAAPMAGAALTHLALLPPSPISSPSLKGKLTIAAYAIAGLTAVGTIAVLLGSSLSTRLTYPWMILPGLLAAAAGLFFFLACRVYLQFVGQSPFDREQNRLILVGAAISFGPMVLWQILSIIFPRLVFSPLLIVPVGVFPIIAAYTIQRFQAVQADYILNRVALYGVVTVLAAVAYALLVSGLGLVTANLVSPNSPLVVGGVFFLMALALDPIRIRVKHQVDSVFLRSESIYQEKITQFGHELTSASEMPEIVKVVRKSVSQTLAPQPLHLFVFNPALDQYSAVEDETGQTTTDMNFLPESPLVSLLQKSQVPMFIDSNGHRPAGLETDSARLTVLASQIFVPLPGQQRLVGWLALGQRGSGEPYTRNDLSFLESLASQSALAIERAQVVEHMENRVREMNVLARLAQGVNITLAFDDILELIYAQSNQIIAIDDFTLTLYESRTGVFQHAFYLEKDDRVFERENHPLPPGQGLDQEVVRGQRSIITSDYQRECQRRNVLPHTSGLFAWMSVPLNSGAETIGALSLGSRDSAVVYTAEQISLLQSIADQTAGAIVKARLLAETERRARQLATLNEMTHQLSSTLDLELLLHNILKSAVDLINCEAGSLLLVDEQTQELVFRVTEGPVAQNLIGKRLPPGSGMVGKSVNTRETIIVNNVQQTKEWFAGTDDQTGFRTVGLLVTPLQVKDTVIGVVEVLNKRGGIPFTPDDQSLLGAFASQAAVAIENARLYTLTDKALTARVEELSVMQRIDRELNASLDVSRAMRITLEWALRQYTADAGLIGVINEGAVQVMASQGYTTELEAYENAPLPTNRLPLQEAIESGHPQQVLAQAGEQATHALLPGTRNQVIIPLKREATAIGIIVLESRKDEPCPEDIMGFLSRLCDHAAIAIANAQLYNAVQSANIAKSEFVSFVSHELKNPMTSIKGYTELLAAGAVGPINDAQGNFLSTIRTNVERMATLVTDLSDLSRIEAGRMKLDFKALKVTEMVEEVVRSLRRQMDEKEQTVHTEIPADLPMIWADRTRLVQVITNLISNANKYTPKGGEVVVGAERTANRWNEKNSGEVVHFWVKDNGIGIAPEDQKKIFQKFFRSEDPKTREAPGTGLGLNITRSLVEMQGGQIWFESEFRQGTTFHITVPISE